MAIARVYGGPGRTHSRSSSGTQVGPTVVRDARNPTHSWVVRPRDRQLGLPTSAGDGIRFEFRAWRLSGWQPGQPGPDGPGLRRYRLGLGASNCREVGFAAAAEVDLGDRRNLVTSGFGLPTTLRGDLMDEGLPGALSQQHEQTPRHSLDQQNPGPGGDRAGLLDDQPETPQDRDQFCTHGPHPHSGVNNRFCANRWADRLRIAAAHRQVPTDSDQCTGQSRCEIHCSGP